jgi:Skp family chaperone for outer membrane proteins
LSAAALFGGLVYFGASADGQTPPTGNPPPSSQQPTRPRIALVNIAKVLKEYNKGAADGMAITKKRQDYVDKIKPLREMLATKTKLMQQSQIPAEKEKLQKEALAVNRQIEDIDQEAQRVLTEMSDRTIVEVYTNIKTVINDIAVTNNLDLVMCYPDASSPDEDKRPAVAQLKLQTPALIPFYHRGMDITEVVVVTLNRRHPAPPVPAVPVDPKGGSGLTPPKM